MIAITKTLSDRLWNVENELIKHEINHKKINLDKALTDYPANKGAINITDGEILHCCRHYEY